MKKEIKEIPDVVIEELKSYPWPGNVRELQNIIERAVILMKDGILKPVVPEIQNSSGAQNSGITDLEEMQRKHIKKILRRTDGVVGGPDGAAKLLGLKRSTLRSRMKKLGITRDELD